MNNQFPAKEGWLRMELTMTTKAPLSEKEIQRMVSFGKPDNYEFGKVEQYGAKIKVILRDKSKIPAAATA